MPLTRTVMPDGARIRALRLELGLSPQELAARSGDRHPQTIRKLERGGKQASELLIHQIARALKVKATDLIKQDGATLTPTNGHGAA